MAFGNALDFFDVAFGTYLQKLVPGKLGDFYNSLGANFCSAKGLVSRSRGFVNGCFQREKLVNTGCCEASTAHSGMVPTLAREHPAIGVLGACFFDGYRVPHQAAVVQLPALLPT